jgi:O-antigen/teichoic acid export membrane protein
MSKINALIRSNAWLTVATIISRLTSALTLPILAQLIGPQSLGVYNVLVSLVQTVQGFSGLGIEITLQRHGARHQIAGVESTGRLFGVSLLLLCTINAVFGLGLWYFRQSLADHWLADASIANWLGIAGILTGLQPIGSIPLLFLASLQEFRSFAIGSSLGLITSNTIVLIFTWHFGLKGAVNGLIVAAVFQIFLSYLILKPVLQSKGIRLRIDHPWQEMLTILKFGLPYHLGTNLLFSLINLPLMGLVSNHSGLESLGYLRVAQSLSALAGFIPLATAPAVISHLSASAEDLHQSQYLKSVHLRSVWILLLFNTTIICLFLPDIIPRIFGIAYRPAIIFAWILVWAGVLTGISAVFIQYLVADGKTADVGWFSAIGAFFWVVPAVILIPRYGVLGFLISYVFSSIVELLLLGFAIIENFGTEESSLLKNITGLSGFLFTLSSVVFFYNFISISARLVSLVIVLTSLAFIFGHAFHSFERIKIKKTLQAMFFSV